MAGRALIGIVIGGFWSMSAATVMRLVPEGEVASALGILNAGERSGHDYRRAPGKLPRPVYRLARRVLLAYVETLGAYAESCVVPEHFLMHPPATVDYETAAASMLKGLTAQYLLRRTFRVSPGDIILVQAAAGGVGIILTQWAKHLGATVFGTVGSPEKAEIARRNGCDHVINYNKEDFAVRVKEITSGEGCHVVYDGVGRATFPGSLDCLRPSALSPASALRPGRSRPSTSCSCWRRDRCLPRSLA